MGPYNREECFPAEGFAPEEEAFSVTMKSTSQPGKVGEEALMPSPSEAQSRAPVVLSTGLTWKPGPRTPGKACKCLTATSHGQSWPLRLAPPGLQSHLCKQSKAQFSGKPKVHKCKLDARESSGGVLLSLFCLS